MYAPTRTPQRGFTGGLLAGGLQGAISGAFSAAMFIPIGAHFQRAAAGGMSHALQAQKILAHGIAGGVLSSLQGQFGHGFASAGLTELFAPGIAQIENGAAQTFVAAIVGGTISELSGGKFANGAATGAFSYAFASVAQGKGSGGRMSSAEMDAVIDAEYAHPLQTEGLIAFQPPSLPQGLVDFAAG